MPISKFKDVNPLPRTIFEEVKRNITPETLLEFNKFIYDLISVDEDIVVPFEIAFKYETMGFKPADAFIAAYTAVAAGLWLLGRAKLSY